MAAFRHLLAPGRIGPLSLRNRILVTAMGVNLADAGGFCGERIRAYHAEQARGGAALITMGVVGVGWPRGANIPRQVALSDDRFIPGLRSVADAVHAYGARLAVQLHFGGALAMEDALAGCNLWVPSAPPAKGGDLLDGFLDAELAETPFSRLGAVRYHDMDAADIAAVVGWFVAAARRARQAGIDGIELHAGHGYLLSSFLSPLTNRRDDDYGGTLENRARLLTDIIGAVRAEVGRDLALWCKLDAREYGQPEGIALAEAIAVAGLAAAAGVDAIAVTAYHDNARGELHSGSHTPDQPGLLLDSAAAIRAALNVPVIATGRIEPAEGDRRIAAGHCDFVAMGRKLLADPHLPRKLVEGRAETVRPCIYCYTCISETYLNRAVKCAVNPELAAEHALRIEPTQSSRPIAVVGGGPAGLEAARRLAMAGHAVTLFERAGELGGTLRFAALAYAPNERLLRWLLRELAAARVRVRLAAEVDAALLRELGFDTVVVATGARREAPALPGVERAQVFSGDRLRELLEGAGGRRGLSMPARCALALGRASGVLRRRGLIRRASHWWLPFGRRLVIVGGELVGLELAEFFAQRGREVVVLEQAPKPGAGLPVVRRWRLLAQLRAAGVTLLAGVREISIDEAHVRCRNRHGQWRRLAADQVILASGARADTALADSLRAAGFTVHTAGDCDGVSYISGAMAAAARVAQAIA